MSKQNYLVKATTYFVDPHGSPDEGGTDKFITQNVLYERTKPEKFYTEELIADADDFDNEQEIDEYFSDIETAEDDLQGSEDGYNRCYFGFEVKKVTVEKAKAYAQFIKDYNKL